MKAAGSYEASKGTAYVRFYNNGSFHDYEIDITDLKYGDSKNITFKVTSGELLKLTNGIVQGMSGSPIIQNGKIIGAVTHVLLMILLADMVYLLIECLIKTKRN